MYIGRVNAPFWRKLSENDSCTCWLLSRSSKSKSFVYSGWDYTSLLQILYSFEQSVAVVMYKMTFELLLGAMGLTLEDNFFFSKFRRIGQDIDHRSSKCFQTLTL